MNLKNFQMVLNVLAASPSIWDQRVPYHSLDGRKHDFGGLAHMLCPEYRPMDLAGQAYRKVREWLDLNSTEVQWLFSPQRTIEDFKIFFDQGGFPEKR